MSTPLQSRDREGAVAQPFIGWRIEGQFDADIAIEIVLDVPGDDPPVVFELAPVDGDWSDIEILNARLIAATPLMLRTLKLASAGMAITNDGAPFAAAAASMQLVIAAIGARA